MNRLRNLFRNNAKRGTFKADAGTIYLYDMIAADEADAEWGGISPKGFIDALAATSGPVTIRINCPGGDAFAGNAMAQAVRQHPQPVTCQVDGVCASAATIVAAAAKTCTMAPGSTLMIHNAWTMAIGDRNDMTECAALLAKIDGLIAQNYADKCGKPVADFAAMMDAETWFTPDEAMACGLCDGMADANNQKAANKAAALWDLSAFRTPPKNDTTIVTDQPVTVTPAGDGETTVITIEDDSAEDAADGETMTSEDAMNAMRRRMAVELLLKTA